MAMQVSHALCPRVFNILKHKCVCWTAPGTTHLSLVFKRGAFNVAVASMADICNVRRISSFLSANPSLVLRDDSVMGVALPLFIASFSDEHLDPAAWLKVQASIVTSIHAARNHIAAESQVVDLTTDDDHDTAAVVVVNEDVVMAVIPCDNAEEQQLQPQHHHAEDYDSLSKEQLARHSVVKSHIVLCSVMAKWH